VVVVMMIWCMWQGNKCKSTVTRIVF